MARRVRGRMALRSAAETICYERNMFNAAFAQWRQLGSPPTPSPINTFLNNLLLESMLLHARNLRSFLGKRGNSDDILASDFLPRRPRFVIPILSSNTAYRRMNKLLAHPSFKRRIMSRERRFVPLHHEIEAAFSLFRTRLEEHDPEAAKWFL